MDPMGYMLEIAAHEGEIPFLTNKYIGTKPYPVMNGASYPWAIGIKADQGATNWISKLHGRIAGVSLAGWKK